MRIGFHPVADNPIRMAYVPGWTSITGLVRRLDELVREVGETRVIPAPWEPFFAQCPSCRDAGVYAWARGRLEDPADFPLFLALFPDAEHPSATPISRANWQLLCAKNEPSHITQKLMIMEALEMWERSTTEWLKQIVEQCASLGVDASVDFLRERVLRMLKVLEHAVPVEDNLDLRPDIAAAKASHGFDRELLQMDGWTPDPGTIILPVDGTAHSLANEILLMNLHGVALFRGRKLARSAKWERVTLVYLSEGAVTFDIREEPPLIVAGYKDPEGVLRTAQECYRTATERILQAMATRVIRVTP